MTSIDVRLPSTLLRVRRGGRRHPEYAALVAVAVAWVVALVQHGAGPVRASGHAGHLSSPAVDVSSLGAAVWGDLPLWMVMCVAMMVPTALPAVRHVGVNSLRWRRQRAIGGFLVAYLAVWVGFGLVVLPLRAAVDGRLPGDVVLATALAAAAGWQLLPYQRRFRRACHRTVPLPPTGWRAAAGCARFGLRHGTACLGVCWPLMLVMAVVLHESMVWMVVLTATVAAVKVRPGSQPISRPAAVLLATLAVTVLLTGAS